MNATENHASNPADELQAFVTHALNKKLDTVAIWHTLRSAGWKDRDIGAAISATSLDMPVPLPRSKGGAIEAFYHLSLFTCMYVSAVSLILMLFHLIDLTLVDPTEDTWKERFSHGSIRSSISVLVVFFPLYLFLVWQIGRKVSALQLVSGGVVERWLTYLTLFIIAMTILIDGSTLIYMFLEGGLSARFLLKALSLLIVVGGGFVFLWLGTFQWNTTRPTVQTEWIRRLMLVGSIALVVATVVWAGVTIDSPQTLWRKGLDSERIDDLQYIATAIGRHYEDHGQLPADLETLDLNEDRLIDPESGAPYAYQILGEREYQLQAEFSLAQELDDYDYYTRSSWEHPAGVHTFVLEVKADEE